MNKSKSMLMAIVAVVVIGAGGAFAYNASQDSDSSPNGDTQQSQVEQMPEKPNVRVQDSGKLVWYEGRDETTALALLRESDVDVRTADSDFGEFVTGIGDIDADAASEYWAFYVNGELASEGAGTYVTVGGDEIEWKLEQF